MDTKVYEYILAIAEEKNISRAADRFYLSQSVLSRHLKSMEDYLGTALFERRGRQMELTRAGAIFINNAQAILYKEKEIHTILAEMRRNREPHLCVWIEPILRNFAGNRIIPAYRAQHPDVRVTLSACCAANVQRAVLDGQIDVAVVASQQMGDSVLEIHILQTDEMTLIGPPDLVMDGHPADLTACLPKLAALQFLVHSPASSYRYLEEAALAALDISPVCLESDGPFSSRIRRVAEGGHAAFLPARRLSVHEDVRKLAHFSFSPIFYLYYLCIGRPEVLRRTEAADFLQLVRYEFSHFDDYLSSVHAYPATQPEKAANDTPASAPAAPDPK